MLSLEHLLAEVSLLRQEVASLRSVRPAGKSPCQGVTGKGTPCRNGALPETCYCRMHSREPKVRKEVRPRIVKVPKIIPSHDHPIGDFSDTCALCHSHGDCIDASLPDHEFEGSDDLTDRLRHILSEYEVNDDT
jgi:hypothetical protein